MTDADQARVLVFSGSLSSSSVYRLLALKLCRSPSVWPDLVNGRELHDLLDDHLVLLGGTIGLAAPHGPANRRPAASTCRRNRSSQAWSCAGRCRSSAVVAGQVQGAARSARRMPAGVECRTVLPEAEEIGVEDDVGVEDLAR